MVRISIRMIRIPFEWSKFAVEWFESHSSGSRSRSTSSNFRVRILFEWLKYALECFKSIGICVRVLQIPSKRWNLHSSASNPVRMVGIYIRVLQITLNGWNSHSSTSNPVRMVEIGIQVLWISFKCLEMAFECFAIPFPMVGISIRMFRMLF